MKRPNINSSSTIRIIGQPVIESIAKYKGLIKSNNSNKNNKYVIKNYINKNTNDVTLELKELGFDTVILGDGDKIVKQYPSSGTEVITNDKVYLVTNNNVTMPSLIDYSRIDAISILNLLNINYEIEGYGFVTEQSVKKGDVLPSTIKITLKPKHNFD